MSARRRVLPLLAALLAAAIAWWLLRERQEPAALEIGYDTTRVTEPRGPDGRVDFLAALDTAEAPAAKDNAAIPILRALGTRALVADTAAVLARLGESSGFSVDGRLVEPGLDVRSYMDFDELDSDEDRDAYRGWVRANDEAIDLLVSATERPRLWWPIVRSATDGLLGPAISIEAYNRLVDALDARATVRLADGRTRDGWTDARALLRLQGLVDQLTGTLSRVMATSHRGRAFAWIARALAAPRLDTTLCEEILDVLQGLPARRGIAADVGSDRLMLIDAYIRQVAGEIEKASGDPHWHPANTAINAALRTINAEIDATLPLLDEVDARHLARLQREAKERHRQVKVLGKEIRSVAGGAEHAVKELASGGAHTGRLVGHVLATMVLSVVPVVIERMLESASRRQLLLLAVASRLHRLRSGAFPGTLRELVPATLSALPLGPVEADVITYAQTDGGCAVSFGDDPENRIDVAR